MVGAPYKGFSCLFPSLLEWITLAIFKTCPAGPVYGPTNIICRHSGLDLMAYVATFSTLEKPLSPEVSGVSSRSFPLIPGSTATTPYVFSRLNTISAQPNMLPITY